MAVLKKRYLLIISCGLICSLHAYTKFKFIERGAHHDLKALAIRPPFSLEKADYSFTHNNMPHKEIKNYVYLTTQDRKKIQKILSHYDPKLAVSQEMIQRFKSSGRLNSNVVGLVLQDFKIYQKDVTIGNILDTINKAVQKSPVSDPVKM